MIDGLITKQTLISRVNETFSDLMIIRKRGVSGLDTSQRKGNDDYERKANTSKSIAGRV